MIVTSRSGRPSIVLAGLAVAGSLVGAPTAAAGPSHGPAVCHPSVEAGVEVDTCTGNPNALNDSGPGNVVRVVPEFCFGIGVFGCDDD